MRTRVGRRRVFGEAGRACDGADFCRGGFAWCLLRGFLARACGSRFAADGFSFSAEADARGDGFVALFFFGMAGFEHVVVTEECAFERFAMASAEAIAGGGFAFAPKPERVADARVYEADTERHEGESGRCAGGAAEFLCGVRRRAAAVCRTGLPGRAATVSRARPPGQAPAKRGREQAPALHTGVAEPGARGGWAASRQESLPGTACCAPTRQHHSHRLAAQRQVSEIERELRSYGVVTQVKQALREDSAGFALGPCDTGGGGPCAVTAMRCQPEEKTFSEVVPLMPWTRPFVFTGSGTVPSTNASSMLDEVSYTTNCSTQFVVTFAEQAGVREKS